MDDIDKDILDFEDEANIDIKIKPNYYIHTAILMAQKTLLYSVAGKSSINDGFIAYSVLIEQIEVLSRAAGYLTQEYDTAISEFKQSNEYIETNREDVKIARLANKKIELLMSQIFQRSPIEMPLNV